MNPHALTIERARWNDLAAAMLAASVRRAPCFQSQDYARMLTEDPQNTILFRVVNINEIVGFVILRIEHFAGGSEGVILAASGRLQGVDLTADLLPHLESKFKGVRGIRISTARPGLVRKLLRQGYELTHYTLRKVPDAA